MQVWGHSAAPISYHDYEEKHLRLVGMFRELNCPRTAFVGQGPPVHRVPRRW